MGDDADPDWSKDINQYIRCCTDHDDEDYDNDYQKVYTHKKAKGVEYMVVDALAEADIVWNREISNAIWSPQEFIKLDDTILKRIEWSREPGLQKGRDLVRRIRTRDLYTYVNEYTVPEHDIPNFTPVCEGFYYQIAPTRIRPRAAVE